MPADKPYLWIVDSPRQPLAESMDVFDGWSDAVYIGPDSEAPEWDPQPDAILFSAELPGGATGDAFLDLMEGADSIPLVAVARTRSLGQALSYFRAGVADYLSLPLDSREVVDCLAATLERVERQKLALVMSQIEPVADGENRPRDSDEVDILSELASETAEDGAEEPEPVDGLPIPNLWEELPCGLLVFDSGNNLVFTNSLCLDLFGHESLAALQEALENRRASFSAHGVNNKPLGDNQWPHILARKTKTPRSAVISIAKPDRRRLWLRCDCMPHLAEGKVNRLTMTAVNLTGELPDLAAPARTGRTRQETAKPKTRKRK